jgi:uncharacterized protein YjdB
MKVRTSVLRGFALLALSSLTFAACDERTTTVAPPTQITVTVTPSVVTDLQVGQTASLIAVVNGTDNQAVTWTSSNNAVATVSAAGVVTAVAPGTAGIVARSTADNTAAGTASVTVVAAPPAPTVTLQIVPSAAPVQVGSTLQLVGVVGGSSNQTVNWISTDPTIATVGPTSGVVTGVSVGTVVIQGRPAADNTVVQTAVITVQAGPTPPQVTISVTPTQATTSVGDSVRFVASVQGPAGVSQNVTWSSLTPTIATVTAATGWATGVAPGTAVLRVCADADTTRCIDVSLNVTATPPPPPPPSISIASILTPGGIPINPTAVAGQIDATVNISAVPANNVRSVSLLIAPVGNPAGAVEICRQDFTPALGTTQSVATINCPINTAAVDSAGRPLFPNGNYVISAVAYTNIGGQAGGGELIAEAVFCPQGQSQNCVVTFMNANVFGVSWEVTPVSGTGPMIGDDNLLWYEGSVTVRVRPALFTGGTLQTMTNVCLSFPLVSSAATTLPAGSQGPNAATGSSCRSATNTAGTNEWVATFPKSSSIGTGGVANVSNSNVGVSVGAVQLLVGGNQATVNNQVGPASPSPLRLDNLAPRFDATAFPGLIGPFDNYAGIGFAFSSMITAFNDPYPGVGGATMTFHVAPTATAGGLTNQQIVDQFAAVTTADELTSQLTNNFYTLVIRVVDAQGNQFLYRHTQLFGVDLVRPTNTLIANVSLGATAINPDTFPDMGYAFYRIQVTDEFSGVDENTTLQIRVAQWFNVGATDTRRCLTAVDPMTFNETWSATTGTTGITACPWVSFPLVHQGGQIYLADVPVYANGDGFYEFQIRTRDRAGNTSDNTHMFSYYIDYTDPAGSQLSTLTISGLGGAAFPPNQIVGTTQATVTGVVVDNIEVGHYDVRLDYGGNFNLPFVLRMQVGTYGLPLTESQNVQRTTPLIALRDANNFATLWLPTAASFGVWDMAENFAFSSNIVFASPMAPSIPTAISSATAPAFDMIINPTAINRTPTAQTTLVTARFTLQDLSIQAPIREVFFYAWNNNATTPHYILLANMTSPTGVLTGTFDRTFRWEQQISAAQLDSAGPFPAAVEILIVFVDQNNNGYYVWDFVTLNN